MLFVFIARHICHYRHLSSDHIYCLFPCSTSNISVADPGGPVKISHKKDGHQRRLHRFHVSRHPPPPPTLPLDALPHLLRKHSKIKFLTISAISGMVQKEVDCFVSPSMLHNKSRLNKNWIFSLQWNTSDCTDPSASRMRFVFSLFSGFILSVLSLGYAILTVRITEAFGLPRPSLFCNVQRDVASLPSYGKLKSNSSDMILI